MSIRDTKQAKRLIEAMAPEGEFLAFINEREAQMLRDAGGSGIMTLAGIPSFVEYGDISGATASQDQVDSFSGGDSGFDDTADVNLGLTRGPTITTGEDQEDDNARMMQALGIPPGVTFSGTDNLINPGGGPSIKNIGLNAALYQLATKNPKAYAALQLGMAAKGIFNQFRNPDLGLNLTKMEEKELTTLQRGEDLGLNDAKQSERLQELKDKKAAEEEKK
tara:strand:- start:30 stop:692 length:663 start_codon:yes stop_codon:yes gene_type:complete